MMAIAWNKISHGESLHISRSDYKTAYEESVLHRNLQDKCEIGSVGPGCDSYQQAGYPAACRASVFVWASPMHADKQLLSEQIANQRKDQRSTDSHR